MVVRVDDGWERGLVLLPGDSEFDSMRLATDLSLDVRRIVGMMASHHGGKLNVFSIPETKAPGARLVISTGKNGYGHPNLHMLENYKFQGWNDQRRTTDGKTGHHHASYGIGATLVQPERFGKPKCECERVVKARMSSDVTETSVCMFGLPADFCI
ncbi:hypothetical protein [Burkholderia sp. Ax-1719]|uniref:hypothetical protein n=1 Tax=Burkholderia sp. Ax-1719 TaxID=2608334 RepID=UPI001421E4B4|nr:hypothetical protein [Burkholderia sp. Ax-1719]NIE65909.1 hypothetical protein [Burkholderia sp. Ax-1719]